MRQFYTARVKATIETDVFIRADDKNEATKRAKKNLKDHLEDSSVDVKNIKVIDIKGEFDK